MIEKCKSCCNYRHEDGCRWCDKGILPTDGCKAYAKRLSAVEVERVKHLQCVWEYLYGQRVYHLCDYISWEIGLIKGTMTESEILSQE